MATVKMGLLFACMLTLVPNGLQLAYPQNSKAESDEMLRLHNALPVEAKTRTIQQKVVVKNDGSIGKVWSGIIAHTSNTKYIALHFSSFDTKPEGVWKILIKDMEGNLRLAYDSNNLFSSEEEIKHLQFWTDDITAQSVLVELVVEQPSNIKFEIDRYLYEEAEVAVKSLMKPKESKIIDISNFREIDKYYKPAKSVAKLSIYTRANRYPCTGFVVAPFTILTNDHCLPDRNADLDEIWAVFGYETGLPVKETVRCSTVASRNYPLDLAVLKCTKDPSPRWGLLVMSSASNVSLEEELFIVQHPDGKVKSIALQDCKAASSAIFGRAANSNKNSPPYLSPQDFRHTCDTIGGSSGSPVLNSNGEVVGVHHYGFDSKSEFKLNQAVLAFHIGKWLSTN